MLKQMKARGGDNDKKFYKAVLGDDIVASSNDEYSELSTVLEMGGISAFRIWDQLFIGDRARILARQTIYGMIQVISRYYEEKDDLDKRKRDGK